MKGVLTERWIADIKEEISAPPTIIDNENKKKARILIGTKKGTLLVLDIEGNILWTYAATTTLSEQDALFVDDDQIYAINGSPTVFFDQEYAEPVILVATEEGKLHAISATGEQKWVVQTGGPLRSSPSVVQDKQGKNVIIIGSHDGCMYFISSKGEVHKKIDVNEPIQTKPAVYAETIFFGTTKGIVYALTFDGQLKWGVRTNQQISADLTITQTIQGHVMILAPSEDKYVYAISFDGELYWKAGTHGALVAPVAVVQTTPDSKEIVFGSTDNSIYCLNSEDGEELWSYQTDFWIVSKPLVEKGDGFTYIIVGSYDSHLYVLDAQGSYELDFIPGLGGVVNQGTYQVASVGKDAGNEKGKVLSQYHIDGFVIGCGMLQYQNQVIAVTKKGKVYNLSLV